MKNARLFVLFALTVALVCTSAFAQGDRPRGGGGRGLPRDLNLTADQKAQVESIHHQERTKMEDLSKQSLTREQFRNQAREIQRSTREQVEAVLTPDQRAKLQADHARQARRGEGERGPMPRRQQ